jgi:hypothetical protein
MLLVAVTARADVLNVRIHTTPSDLAVPQAAEAGVGKAASVAPERGVLVVIPRGHTVLEVIAHPASHAAWHGTTPGTNVPAAPVAFATQVGGWFGWSIAAVQLQPVFQDGNGLALAGDVDLEVRTAPGGDMPLARLRANPARDEREAALMRASVANPEQVAAFAPPQGRHVDSKRGGFQPAAFPDLEGSDVQYVIVTSQALAPAFQALADWKTRRGVPAVVRTIESIQANYRHGADLQETIRTFMQDAYSKWSVDWVLLGGDTDIIPARYLSSSFGLSSPEAIPSDLYFAGLDGNWNNDGDMLWGEAAPMSGQPDPDGGDLLADVYVGRAPVSNATQVAAFVQKVITYETPTDPTYQGNTLFLGEVLFPANWDTSQTITMDGAQLSEDIINSRIVPAGGTVLRRYEDFESFPSSQPLSRALSLADIGSGYNLVNHIGHGFRYNMSVGDKSIVNADADVLANANRLAVLNILNCTSLAFDYSCLAEHFVLNPSGGAVAVVGASRSAYPLPAREYQDDWYELLFSGQAWHFGELFARSRLNQTPLAGNESAHRWTHYIYNALGDPEMTVFEKIPVALSVGLPASAALGTNNLTITVQTGGSPVAGARVCLQKGNDDYRVGTTLANGTVQLGFVAESPGSISVAVSGRDLRTFLGSIPVGTGAGSYLHVDAIAIDDDNTGGTIGNGNGVIDAGETVDLLPTLRNDGSAASVSASVLVSEADASVTLVTPACSVPAMGAGATAAASAPVRLAIAASAADQQVFELTFTITAGASVTQDKLRKAIHAPKLELVHQKVIDTALGNGNGEPDEDEVFDLVCTIKNYGSGRVDGLNAVLQTSDHFVTILQSSASFGNVDPLVEASNTVHFQLSESVPGPSRINLRLTDNRGRLVVLPFELERPAAPFAILLDPSHGPTIVQTIWPPASAADLAGYHVYRALASNGPWTRATSDYVRRTSSYRDTGLSTNTRYWYYVTAVDSSGNESVPSPSSSVSTNPPQALGWPVEMAAETSSSPAVGDLDGDDVPEIVTGDGSLYAWHGNGQEVIDADGEAQTWGVFSTAPGTITASVALGELDGSAGLEVVACSWNDNGIYVVDGNGALLWSRSPAPGGPAGYWGTPAIGDVDRDGHNEVFAVSKDGHIYAWKYNGAPLLAANPSGLFANVGQYDRSSPALGNLDDDFDLEIVETDAAGNLYAWNRDGTSLPGFPKAYGAAFFNSPVLGDVDGDGKLEIVAVHQTGANNLHVLRGNGTELAGFPITVNMKSAAISPTPALADLDGDGKLEIVVGSNEYVPGDSKLYVFRWNGTQYPGWPQPTFTDTESSPIVADFDGDGHSDIAFGGQDGVLRGWRRDGTELQGFPLSVGDFIRATPTAADVDGDGGLDLVFAGWDGTLYVWDFPVPFNAALAQWPSYLHDAQRTARYGFTVRDATDAGDATAAAPPAHLELAQNQPNPFNPSTTIAFALPAAGAVRLEVYDVHGHRIRGLVDGVLPAGPHRIAWDGRDGAGRRAASGLYFYRLQWSGHEQTRRMVLLK